MTRFTYDAAPVLRRVQAALVVALVGCVLAAVRAARTVRAGASR